MLIFLYIVLCLLVTFYQLCYMFNNIYDITHIGNRVFYISLALIVPIVAIGGWMHILWYILVHIATYIISLILSVILYRWYYKKRFGPPKKRISYKITIPIVILCILLISSTGTNIYQAVQNRIIQNTISEQETEISSLENKLKSEKNTNSALRIKYNWAEEKLSFYEEKLSFYEDHVVIVPNNNTYTYHIYGCKYCDTTRFWAYNTEAARDRGYSPCKYCCS